MVIFPQLSAIKPDIAVVAKSDIFWGIFRLWSEIAEIQVRTSKN